MVKRLNLIKTEDVDNKSLKLKNNKVTLTVKENPESISTAVERLKANSRATNADYERINYNLLELKRDGLQAAYDSIVSRYAVSRSHRANPRRFTRI